MAEITVTKDNFQSEVLDSDIPVFVDFWAEWCGPCKMVAPVVAELAEDYAGRLKVGKVNVDEQQQLAVQFQVSAIPTMIIFKDGQAVDSIVGFLPKSELEKAIAPYV